MAHETPTSSRAEANRITALKMLRDVLSSLIPSLPQKLDNEELVAFLLTPDTLEIMQESIAKGRGMRKTHSAKPGTKANIATTHNQPKNPPEEISA